MPSLPDGDVRRVLAFLYEAGEVDGPDAFTEPVLEAFYDLIPGAAGAACNTFAGEAPGVDPERRTVLSFAVVDADWCIGMRKYWNDELDEISRRYVETEEAIPPVPRYMNRPVRISDVLTRREQQRRNLWALIERPLGQEDAVWIWLPAPDEGLLRRIAFAAERRGGISDRSVHILELLTPHLQQLHRRAAARRSTAEWPGDLTPREREVLRLVARGQTNREVAHTLWISPHTVRTHLENVFEKLGVTSRAAAVARVSAVERHENGNALPRRDAARRAARNYAALTPGATLINKHVYA
jgi:DNA-binding CsgD family transcriptional regulator